MPRITRHERLQRVGESRASMRPGRNAPDNVVGIGRVQIQIDRFNEAGAKCPG